MSTNLKWRTYEGEYSKIIHQIYLTNMINKLMNWKWAVLMLIGGVFAIACEQEDMSFDFTNENLSSETSSKDGNFEKHRKRCFKLVFPITVDFPDGTAETYEDQEALKTALKAWKEANPEAEGRPMFAMPYDVTLADGTVVTVTDETVLESLKEDCKPDRRRERCFELVFPITVNFPDGTSQEVADREALRTALGEWKEANPEAEDRPMFAMPYDVTLADGTVVTVTDETVLESLKEECKPDRRRERCFELVFPVTVAFPDGTTAEVENSEALRTLFETYKEENPETRERPEVQFPYDVQLQDGSTATLASVEDLIELRKTCGEDRRGRRRGGRRGR